MTLVVLLRVRPGLVTSQAISLLLSLPRPGLLSLLLRRVDLGPSSFAQPLSPLTKLLPPRLPCLLLQLLLGLGYALEPLEAALELL